MHKNDNTFTPDENVKLKSRIKQNIINVWYLTEKHLEFIAAYQQARKSLEAIAFSQLSTFLYFNTKQVKKKGRV